MKAVCFVDKGRVAVEDRPRPSIQDATDAVVRITKTAICGSDLHFYHGRIPMAPGFVVGHEMLGIVEDVGIDVRTLKAGDRVVVSDIAACGSCWFCRRRYFVNCVQSKIFGYGERAGNLPGGQADFVRVPFADTTCGLPPPGLSDERALFVGDILVTGYTCAKNAGIQPGDTVVVIGCGPVGMFAQMCARLYGPARGMLKAERVALNFLQHLSGIATTTSRIVKAVDGTRTRILDTRKTTPGLRALEKYATRMGGALNHRMGLYDAVLIKDTHLALVGGIGPALRAARKAHPEVEINVEVSNLQELELALADKAPRILLDNFSCGQVREAMQIIRGRAIVEISGGVTAANARAYALAGADFISVGALTHSAKALDFSMKVTRY